MKKNLNKLATLALTGMVVAGVSFGAMAATAPERGEGTDKWDGTTTVTDDKFSFNKYLNMEENYTSVPHVEFEFGTVAGKDADGGEVDSTFENPVQIAGTGTNNTLPVYYGPAGLTATVEFGSKNSDGSDDLDKTVTFKTKDENNEDVDVTGSAFSKSGIYRFALGKEKLSTNAMNELYKNNENTSFNLNTNNVEYMDVYVVNGATEGSFKISNVVLMSSVPEKGITSDNGAVSYSTAKLSGINNEYTTKHGDNEKEDNKISIEKKLAGSIQNESEKFTFKIYFTNVTSDFKVNVKYLKDDAEETSREDAGVKIMQTEGEGTNKKCYIEVTLVGNEKVEITGLPVGIKYEVKETSNNNYTPKIKLNNDENVDKDGGKDKDVWTLDERALSSDLVDNIEWTNTRRDITVTGVAVNIAPYAAMVLGAGAFAGIFLGGKRRKAEDED